MIRLTVLYNLQPHVDEEKFLAWRLTDHQAENMSISGLLRSDFARIDRAWPNDTPPPYRFMTTADWPDWESFEQGFYDPKVQQDLEEDLKILKDPVLLISEILIQETREANQ